MGRICLLCLAHSQSRLNAEEGYRWKDRYQRGGTEEKKGKTGQREGREDAKREMEERGDGEEKERGGLTLPPSKPNTTAYSDLT